LLGSLIYLLKSRPDIATAVCFSATFAAKPTAAAYEEMLHCLAYLYATRYLGLLLKAGEPGRELTLKCHVDASYLTHTDSKSHSGYTLSFGDVGTFYSKSGKQTLVTTSSTHAEMRALYALTVDLIYLVHLCVELGRPVMLPCIVFEDNQPTIDLLKEPTGRTKRCKHFLMLISYIREQVLAGYLSLVKVPTTENIADVLTKIITGGEFGSKAALLLGTTSN